MPHLGRELAFRELPVRDRRGVCGPHGKHACDFRVSLEQRGAGRIDGRRETVEHAREAVLGLQAHALAGEAVEQDALRRQRVVRPAAFLRVRRAAAGRGDPLRERRRLQDDDHTLSEGDARPRADEPAP